MKLKYECWTCGDPQDDCNGILLTLDGKDITSEFNGLFFAQWEDERKLQKELLEILLSFGFDYDGPPDSFHDMEYSEEREITEAQAEFLINWLKENNLFCEWS